eukprot:TRINITY_DN7104_c0_g1_i1.p1 TRINITY_DN7104_c0_g1~~TRINITY_DN7104_c0_g1_i1.p1  ORF type:complete len:732 (+),score=140.11 TRINITY_DN7104_c0_g1_i1:22-2217(+)
MAYMYEEENDLDTQKDEEPEEDCWAVISAYFQEKGLVRQQLDSYDDFMTNTIQELVDESDSIHLFPQTKASEVKQDQHRITIKFGQIYLSKPSFTEKNGETKAMWPNDARIRNLSYSANLYIDMEKTSAVITADGEEIRDPDKEELDKVPIGRVPIMLRSKYCLLSPIQNSSKDLTTLGECEYDEGGYFVVNGVEKVLIAQERMSNNHVYVFNQPPGSKYSHVAEIRSRAESDAKPTSTLYVKLLRSKSVSSGVLKAQIPYVKDEIPVVIIFRALGFVADREILEHICYDLNDKRMMELLRPSLTEAFVIQNREVALDFIGKRGNAGVGALREKRIKYARELLQKEMLPHVGTGEFCETKKAYFFGYIIHRILMCALGRRGQDDRDHFANKRMDLAGPLLATLFRQLFRKLTRNLKLRLQKSLDNSKDFCLTKSLKFDVITNGLNFSLATGNWSANKGNATKVGVSQVLNRLTFVSTLSHLRRLNTPIGRESKLAKPRQLHNTHWGMVCPAETPEGQMCGLVKNLALMAYISVGSDPRPVLEFLEEWSTENLEEISPSLIPEATKIFVNGAWVGIHRQPDQLVKTLRQLRRCEDVSAEVSIVRDITDRELRLYTDPGRCCRPLFIVENQSLVITREHINKLQNQDPSDPYGWPSLIHDGIVEYIDAEEEETIMIAMSVDDLKRASLSEKSKEKSTGTTVYTHCEIHPSMILGICGSIIPFPDHNQSPRTLR